MESSVRCRLFELGNLEWVDKLGPVSKEPAILIIDGLDGKRNTLAVVWYDAERRDQFEFHLMTSLSQFEEAFATHPETGTVIFLGQVKDWPNAEARADLIKELRLTDEDSYIVHWIVPIGMGRDKDGRPLPVSTVCEVILIGHPQYGLLRPESYFSEEAKIRVMRKFLELLGYPSGWPSILMLF